MIACMVGFDATQLYLLTECNLDYCIQVFHVWVAGMTGDKGNGLEVQRCYGVLFR